ncbi:MAG: conjugative transposon protein TraN, partial [Sphingobacteriales bacterium]
MKNYLKTFWAAALMIGSAAFSYAQQTAKTP